MNNKFFSIAMLLIGILSVSSVTYVANTEADRTYSIMEYISPSRSISIVDLVNPNKNSIQNYAELSHAYMEMAADYADDACDEAEAAEEARENGDYEGFQDHLEAAEEASDNAEDAADQAEEYADMIEEILEDADDDADVIDGSTDSDDDADAVDDSSDSDDYADADDDSDNSNTGETPDYSDDEYDSATIPDEEDDLDDDYDGLDDGSDWEWDFEYDRDGWGDMGLGENYDVYDLENYWEMQPRWEEEDLFGIFIDPEWGMEHIPEIWDWDRYINPDYWYDKDVFLDDFLPYYEEDYYYFDEYYEATPEFEFEYEYNYEYDMPAYYYEALEYFDNLLVGEDLDRFYKDQNYQDFLINVYVNTYLDTPAYQAVVSETYAQGYLDYNSYVENIQGQVDGYDYSLNETYTKEYWEANIVNTELYFETGNTSDAYIASVNFYENTLVGEDLNKYQSNEAYHNYMTNVYLNAQSLNDNYANELSNAYLNGELSYEGFTYKFTENLNLFETQEANETQDLLQEVEYKSYGTKNMIQQIYSF